MAVVILSMVPTQGYRTEEGESVVVRWEQCVQLVITGLHIASEPGEELRRVFVNRGRNRIRAVF